MGNDIQTISKEIAKEMNYAKKWIAIRTATKMRNKLIKVYDDIIEQFYSRIPTSYRRHDVTPFTAEGINLYRALQSHTGAAPKLMPSAHTIDGGIEISSADMVERNYHVSKDIVLDYVLDGIRFPATQTSNGIYRGAMEFTVTYDDGDCHAQGTPLEVLESVRDQLVERYTKEAKEEAKKELKLKYVELT